MGVFGGVRHTLVLIYHKGIHLASQAITQIVKHCYYANVFHYSL
jgi:hypothetical protein